jgi:hypothetical protein
MWLPAWKRFGVERPSQMKAFVAEVRRAEKEIRE